MSELAFPAAALVVVVLGAMPAATLLARGLLVWQRRRARSWGAFGSWATWALLVAPTALPLGWLVSGTLHQLEADWLAACQIDHDPVALCADALLLLALIGAAVLVSVGGRAWAWRGRPGSAVEASAPVARRVASLCASEPDLTGLRVRVVRGAAEPALTRGLLAPVVEIDACFAATLDDAALRAALRHEAAHVRGRDPLRALIARAMLSLNPAGWLLRDELARWREAREAACDEEALALASDPGAPMALAFALVRAARFRCAGAPRCGVALCGHDRSALRARLALLAVHRPALLRRPRISPVALALATLALSAVLLPHAGEASVLGVIHRYAEAWFNQLAL